MAAPTVADAAIEGDVVRMDQDEQGSAAGLEATTAVVASTPATQGSCGTRQEDALAHSFTTAQQVEGNAPSKRNSDARLRGDNKHDESMMLVSFGSCAEMGSEVGGTVSLLDTASSATTEAETASAATVRVDGPTSTPQPQGMLQTAAPTLALTRPPTDTSRASPCRPGVPPPTTIILVGDEGGGAPTATVNSPVVAPGGAATEAEAASNAINVVHRDKSILCKDYIDGIGGGPRRCLYKNDDCPYLHAKPHALRPLPKSVCIFYKTTSSRDGTPLHCLKGDCPFFHGSEAERLRLQSQQQQQQQQQQRQHAVRHPRGGKPMYTLADCRLDVRSPPPPPPLPTHSALASPSTRAHPVPLAGNFNQRQPRHAQQQQLHQQQHASASSKSTMATVVSRVPYLLPPQPPHPSLGKLQHSLHSTTPTPGAAGVPIGAHYVGGQQMMLPHHQQWQQQHVGGCDVVVPTMLMYPMPQLQQQQQMMIVPSFPQVPPPMNPQQPLYQHFVDVPHTQHYSGNVSSFVYHNAVTQNPF